MQLVEKGLRSRAFVLQFFTIMQEFGDEIPWLNPLKSITYSTNASYFKHQFLKDFGLSDEQQIVPYQFVIGDEKREYVGGILHFPKSPEKFIDKKNREIADNLATANYSFVSCLQVHNEFRGRGYGTLMTRRVLKVLLNKHKKIWGVVSDPRVLSWHISLGAKLLSPNYNEDNLWIISWEKDSFELIPAPDGEPKMFGVQK